MNKQHTLDVTAFAGQTWLIDPEIRDVLLAQLIDQGQVILNVDEAPVHYTDPNWVYYNEASQPGSTAIITISGVIYGMYAQYIVSKLEMIFADKNVSALVVKVNSPGGEADAGSRIAGCLMDAPIPTWAYIEYGQAASAGYMIACSCDGISASRGNDRIGSIGTYISYQNWGKYFEKLGVVSKDIYAKQSTEKNQCGRTADEGDFTLLETWASQQAQVFIDYVKERRPQIDSKKMDPFKGKVYTATDALSIGLIDSIGDLKGVTKSLNSTTTKTNANPRNTMLGFVKLASLAAIKDVAASAITPEQVEAVNTELAAAGYAGIAVVSATEYETAVAAINAQATANTALTTAQSEVARLTAELATEKTSVTALTTERNSLKTQVAAFGSQPGALPTNPAKAEEKQETTTAETEAEALIAALPHNKALEGTWLSSLAPATK